jgi:hypothetical protein
MQTKWWLYFALQVEDKSFSIAEEVSLSSRAGAILKIEIAE